MVFTLLLWLATVRADEVDNFQKAWDKIETLSSEVKQTSENKALGLEPEVQTGTLLLKKPGFLRFDSVTEKPSQVVNPKEFILIKADPKNNRQKVEIFEIKRAKSLPKAFEFLSGKKPFKMLYNVQSIEDKGAKRAIRFVPKEGKKDAYIAEIEKNSYLLKTLTIEAGDSKVSLELGQLKTNEKIEDSKFKYQPDPKDLVNRETLKE